MDNAVKNSPLKMDNRVNATLTQKALVARSTDGVEVVLTIVHVVIASTTVI